MKRQFCKTFRRTKHEDDYVDNQLQKYLDEHPEYSVVAVGYDVKKSGMPISPTIKNLKQHINTEEHLFVVFSENVGLEKIKERVLDEITERY